MRQEVSKLILQKLKIDPEVICKLLGEEFVEHRMLLASVAARDIVPMCVHLKAPLVAEMSVWQSEGDGFDDAVDLFDLEVVI